jgi:hypothetical protein
MKKASALSMVVLALACAACPPHHEAEFPPPTGEDCHASCTVLEHFGCPEGNSTCESRCQQTSALGYMWTSDKSGPKCVRRAGTLEAVRACRVRCILD